MRKMTLACLIVAIASQTHAYSYWNDIRYSALLPGGAVTVRMENPTGGGAANRILYAEGGVQELDMAPVLDGPSTLEATVPGPGAEARWYGFRLVQGSELDLMPVRVPDGASPAPADLSRIAEDALGDALYGYTNLDLVDCRISFSASRLYAVLRNAGGGFPVVSGLTFFGYLLGIADPAVSDPDTVIALMHTYTQAGVISPGLYLVTGSGLGNLSKIGEVVVTQFPESNSLMISCALADLAANSYFASWYDPADPRIGVAGFTQRITLLGGAAEADRSPGGRCYLREFSIAPVPNNLPALSSLAVEGSGAMAIAQVDYTDADGNCPVLSELVIDGTSYPMRPRTLDYGSIVVYETAPGIEPIANGSWTTAAARFSDNGADTVEAEITTTDVSDDNAPGIPSALRLSISPNPFNATATIEYFMPAAGRLRIEIYDARGGLVRTLVNDAAPPGSGRLVWNGRSGSERFVASGLYFCTMTALGETRAEKLLLVR
jgi:hypothetical protein